MKDIRNIFRRLEKLLKEAKWFDDEWEIYNRGPYLQLYKSNWYNHNQGGIHFETSIEAPQLKSKSFDRDARRGELPVTAEFFLERFLLLERDRIARWNTYQIQTSENTVVSEYCLLITNLEQRIYGELNQLRQLADGIDQTLQAFKSIAVECRESTIKNSKEQFSRPMNDQTDGRSKQRSSCGAQR